MRRSDRRDVVTDGAPCPICGASARFAYEGTDRLHGLPGSWRYLRCPACRCDFMHPMPAPAEIASFYPPDYADHAPGAPRTPSGMRRAVLRARHGYRHLDAPAALRGLAPIVGCFRYRDEVRFASGGRVLDVGCGSGRYLRYLADLGWAVEGLEPGAAGAAACRVAALDVNEGTLGEVELPADRFDLVTARHVIEHVPDPRTFLAEAARVLKPGGRLVLLTPNARALGRAWFGVDWFPNDPPRHLVLYAKAALAELVREAGFGEIAIRCRTTPKEILNSWDLRRGRTGTASRRIRVRRWLARPYMLLARCIRRGDELALTAVLS